MGTNGSTSISINEVSARYVRIEQKGNTDFYWWSIHEINLFR